MKVRRQKISEEYSTTVGWINDFSSNLQKNADFLDNIKSIMKKRKDFSSIDEKMADIKNRVGYNIVKNIDSLPTTSIKSSYACGCNKCKVCDVKNSYGEDALGSMEAVLKYITDLAKDTPEASAPAIIQHCRENQALGFDKLEDKIDSKKLSDYINDQLTNYKTQPEVVEYISRKDVDTIYDDDTADYISHSLISG
jgi:hypothetical protein